MKLYKDKNIKEYIDNKDLPNTELNKLIDFLKEIIDSNISGYTQKSLDLIKNDDFKTPIEEQGSGVRSLICIAVDMILAKEGSIILIDEPELGLNPSAKYEFLKFLNKESKNKQIFIATHDPTFVNPLLWDHNNVSVFLYSLIDKKFINIDLNMNDENPSCFCGYLPHTTSINEIHIYVEGWRDVNIFKIFLIKYLQNNFKESWFNIINKVGIYHLGGDLWKHLLYTIPKYPYKCIILLDGDKRKIAEQIISEYQKNKFINSPSLKFYKRYNWWTKKGLGDECYVYCLQKNRVEEYLNPVPQNKKEGPKIASSMNNIPEEIKIIFDGIFLKTKFDY